MNEADNVAHEERCAVACVQKSRRKHFNRKISIYFQFRIHIVASALLLPITTLKSFSFLFVLHKLANYRLEEISFAMKIRHHPLKPKFTNGKVSEQRRIQRISQSPFIPTLSDSNSVFEAIIFCKFAILSKWKFLHDDIIDGWLYQAETSSVQNTFQLVSTHEH